MPHRSKARRTHPASPSDSVVITTGPLIANRYRLIQQIGEGGMAVVHRARDELLDRAFDNADTLGSVDTYVHYLRRKLGKGVVETVHGIGYRLGTGPS